MTNCNELGVNNFHAGDEAISEKTKIPSIISVILSHPSGLVKNPRLNVGLDVVDDAAAAATSMELI